MEIEPIKDIINLTTKNNIERAHIEAMNKANEDFQSNKKVLRKDAFDNVIYVHQRNREFTDDNRYDLDDETYGKGTEASNIVIENSKPKP